jgi:hypothetical protein
MRRLFASPLIALVIAIAGSLFAGARSETCYSQSQWYANPTGCKAPGEVTATGAGKTASQCDDEYAANKTAIKASGQTKRAFVAACRAGK